MASHFSELPKGLPRPIDDGGAAHLEGKKLPEIVLESTADSLPSVSLASLLGRVMIYVYPMTGRPGVPLPDGWDSIPGARGCTPQSCSFRDHYADLQTLNTKVFGLSTQTSDYQREARDRLHLPFQLLSDSKLLSKAALGLPTFKVDGMELLKRLTLISENGKIVKVFYPVFPPDKSAEEVLAWLRERTSGGS